MEFEDKELMAYGDGEGGGIWEKETDPIPAPSQCNSSTQSSVLVEGREDFLRLGARRPSPCSNFVLVLCLDIMFRW